MSEDLGVRLVLRNLPLWHAIMERYGKIIKASRGRGGLPVCRVTGELAGIKARYVSGLLGLRRSAYFESGAPNAEALKLADALGAPFAELFPLELERAAALIPKNFVPVEAGSFLIQDSPNLEADTINKDLVKKLLAPLRDIQRRVLTMRSEGYELAEIGAELGITRERVRQIEARARYDVVTHESRAQVRGKGAL